MSDDLIGRKAVISLIDDLGYVNCKNHDDFKANSRVDRIRQAVLELPTAFDKEKVLEELQEAADLSVEDGLWHIELQEAFTIVEKGGIE